MNTRVFFADKRRRKNALYHLIVNPDAGKHKTLRAARAVADFFDERNTLFTK